MIKSLLLLVAGLLSTITFAADKSATHKPDDAAARVGDTVIQWKDVDTAVNAFTRQFTAYGREFPSEQLPHLQYNIVNDMVSQEVVVQASRGHEPKDLDEQVTKQIDQAKLQLGGDEGFTQALAEMGMKRADYERRLREGLVAQAFIKKYVDDKVKISADDTKKFYDENRSKFVTPERVRASHILILVPEGATDEIKAQKLTQIKAAQSLIKGGDKFEDVARKFSEDPGSKEQGGDLSYFTRDRMVKPFADAAFSLKPNEVSDIVTTQFGYHLIKSTDHQAAGERTYAEAKDDIERYLKNQQGQEMVQAYVQELRQKAKIEILLPQPEAPVPTSRVAPNGKAMPSVETKPVAAPKP
ncbi:MAG: Chaperone SurA [Verrucomicrobiae bacterium]|nr:Chaperone SurA [Verrucomicrobiae bacterium]